MAAGDEWMQKRTVRGKDGAEMVLIPAGEFEMGTDVSEIPKIVNLWTPNADPQIDLFEIARRETPRHTVFLDAFCMDVYEVTNEQYRQFVEATGHHPPKGYHSIDGQWQEIEPWELPGFNAPNQPVVCVMWYDAVAYCEWAGKRLPTEAEWEKAARGGLVGKRYAWGNEAPDGTQGNFAGKSYPWSGRDSDDGYQYTAPVGSFPPNNYGLYDMAGNLWEWCADWYDARYYERSPKENPKGPSSGEERIMRGGSWYHYMSCDLRVADRSFDTVPTGSSTIVGFRCAQDVVTP